MNTELKISLVQHIKLFDYKFNLMFNVNKVKFTLSLLELETRQSTGAKKVQKRPKTLQITRHQMDTSALRCKVKFCL